jgi:NitT/TauT family transport system ATP-binding protein
MFTIHTSSDGQDVFALPVNVAADEIVGLVQAAARRRQEPSVSLVSLKRNFESDDDRLLAAVKVAELLGFASVSNGELELTPSGRTFAAASSRDRKRIFGEQLRWALPWIKDLETAIARHPKQRWSAADIAMGSAHFDQNVQLEKGLLQVVEWGRYAGIFDYDSRTRDISLLNSEDAVG